MRIALRGLPFAVCLSWLAACRAPRAPRPHFLVRARLLISSWMFMIASICLFALSMST